MGFTKKYSYTAVPEQDVCRNQTFADMVRRANFSYIRSAQTLQVPEVAAALLSYQLPHRWLLEHGLDGAFIPREENGHVMFDLVISELNEEAAQGHRYPAAAALENEHIVLKATGALCPEADRTITEFLDEQQRQWRNES